MQNVSWHVNVVWMTLIMSNSDAVVNKHLWDIDVIWNGFQRDRQSFDGTIEMRDALRCLPGLKFMIPSVI